jgi:hypothetical protein
MPCSPVGGYQLFRELFTSVFRLLLLEDGRDKFLQNVSSPPTTIWCHNPEDQSTVKDMLKILQNWSFSPPAHQDSTEKTLQCKLEDNTFENVNAF